MSIRGGDIKSCMVTFARMNLNDESNSIQSNELLFSWITDYLLIGQKSSNTLSLEDVIQPKQKPTCNDIRQKMRQLQL
jgi:hypothetical protein